MSWNADFRNVSLCKLGNKTVKNIYDKPGSKYRLLWPHPGSPIETDISSGVDFQWDTLAINKTYTPLTSSSYQGTITYHPGSKTLTQTNIDVPMWYNSDDAVFKAGTYNCSCSWNTYAPTTRIITEVTANAFTVTDMLYDSARYYITFDATYTGTSFDYTDESHEYYTYINMSFTVPDVTCTYSTYDGDTKTVTGDVVISYIANEATIEPKLSNGDSITVVGTINHGLTLPEYGGDYYIIDSIVCVTPQVCKDCVLLAAKYGGSTTIVSEGTCTITEDIPYDRSHIFTYNMDSQAKDTVDEMTISCDTIPVYNPHGKLEATVTPGTGHSTISATVPEGYVAYTKGEDYTIVISHNGTLSQWDMTCSTEWAHTGTTTQRNGSYYTQSGSYSYESEIRTETDPIVYDTYVTTMTTKMKIDPI